MRSRISSKHLCKLLVLLRSRPLRAASSDPIKNSWCTFIVEGNKTIKPDRYGIYTTYHAQDASLRGRLPPPITPAHKQESTKMRTNEADRMAHGFRCKLATCKCQELPWSTKTTRTPHAWTKQKGRRERAVSRQHHTS